MTCHDFFLFLSPHTDVELEIVSREVFYHEPERLGTVVESKAKSPSLSQETACSLQSGQAPICAESGVEFRAAVQMPVLVVIHMAAIVGRRRCGRGNAY